jgi:hypothetical protein
MPRTIVLLILFPFTVLSAAALWYHGYWGIFEPLFKTFGAGQVLADLVISLTLFTVWMWQDAKATGRNPWPWMAITLVAGSFGPLIYLLTRKQPTT